MVESHSESFWAPGLAGVGGVVVLTTLAIAAWRGARRPLPPGRSAWRSLAVILFVNAGGLAGHLAHPWIPEGMANLFSMGRLIAVAILGLGLVWGVGSWDRPGRMGSYRRGLALVAFGVTLGAFPSVIGVPLPTEATPWWFPGLAYLASVGLISAGAALGVTVRDAVDRGEAVTQVTTVPVAATELPAEPMLPELGPGVLPPVEAPPDHDEPPAMGPLVAESIPPSPEPPAIEPEPEEPALGRFQSLESLAEAWPTPASPANRDSCSTNGARSHEVDLPADRAGVSSDSVRHGAGQDEPGNTAMNWVPFEISIPPGHPRAGEKVIEFRREDGQRVRSPAVIAGRYQVEDILTAGGQGAILKARDRVLRGRLVLIKMTLLDLDDIFHDVGMVRPNVASLIEDRREQLAGERSMLLQLNQRIDDRIPVVCHYVNDYSAQLHGPHGAEGWYWDADEDDRTMALLEREPYLVLRYIEGTSLIERLRPDLATDRRTAQGHAEFAIRVGLHLASIFAQFHSRRKHRPEPGDGDDDGQTHTGKIFYYYVYQDLKPENLIVTHGDDLFLIDFGGVEIVEVDDDGEHFYGRRTQTPGYSAPETGLSDPPQIGELSDIYSIGATLYHVLSGKRPPKTGLAEAIEDLRPSLQPYYYGEMLDLVAACVVADPAARREAVGGLRLGPERADTSLTYTLRRNLDKLSKEV